jgi:hypothetical protein
MDSVKVKDGADTLTICYNVLVVTSSCSVVINDVTAAGDALLSGISEPQAIAPASATSILVFEAVLSSCSQVSSLLEFERGCYQLANRTNDVGHYENCGRHVQKTGKHAPGLRKRPTMVLRLQV